MTTAEWAAIASAGAAAVSALFAGMQIRLARLDVRRRAAFDYIRIVGEHVAAYNDVAAVSDPDAVLALYQRRRTDLPPSARAYLRLLSELDLAAYGIYENLLDRKVALGHLKTLLRTDVIELTLLRQLQASLGDPCIYEHLARLLVEVCAERRSANHSSLPPTYEQTPNAPGTSTGASSAAPIASPGSPTTASTPSTPGAH